ncbi:hypothetical protein N5D61_24505 [Pseudomonas sp. GD03842]|nr:hypothetical protein [Pseudomonas sp. GD03842]MDH0749490.1 hypothetical protein [Pseudomonas sp. GD03842]
MSPHILIDNALEGMSEPDCPPLTEVNVMRIITTLHRDNAITNEELAHYCERLYRAVERRARRAA